MTTFFALSFHVATVIGAFALAFVIMYSGWALVMYATGKGDDTHRAHAKTAFISGSLWILAIMILWWLLDIVAHSLGV